MKTRLAFILPLAAALAIAGCVTVPTGPAIMSMPGTGKSFDAFRADDGACRDYAQYQLGPVPGQEGANAAAANAAGGAALGAAAGAIIGAASGHAGPGAAIGAGTGLLFGSAYGSNVAGYTSYDLQRRYDAAYLQCMYAKGNQVPSRFAPRRYYGPPAYGPPPGYTAPPPPTG